MSDHTFVSVPISNRVYNELVIRYGNPDADISVTVENVLDDFLHRTADDEKHRGSSMRTGTTKHAAARMHQRALPPAVDGWLDEYGERDYDGRGNCTITLGWCTGRFRSK